MDTLKMNTDEMFRTLPSIINDKGELYTLHIFKGSKREITKEELVADIRNKLNPISTLIGMVDDYMNGVKSDEECDFINKSIKEQLPIVKDVMEYIKKQFNK